MYYKLNPNLLLRGWDRLPYAVADTRTGKVCFIREQEMDTLQLCSGTVDFSLPMIPEAYRKLIPGLHRGGVIQECKPGDRIDEKQAYRRYPARYIETAHWSITGKCNYRCRHCYMSAPDARLGELSHETIFSIIDQLEACGIMNVTITGGEPLIRKDFLEIVDALLQRGIHIPTIYSNGRLVTDSLLDALAERGIHPEFNMSFDGVGHHDWLRGIPGAEEYAKAAFLRCREKGFPTGAEMCIHRNNQHTLRATVNLLASWGCRSLKTNPISNVGAWKEGGYGESIPLEDLYRLYLDYIPEYYEDGMPLSLQLGGFFYATPRHPDRYQIPGRKRCRDPETTCVCGHARKVLYIAADGRALPCMSLSGMDIQKTFPLIPEIGLQACLTDSAYLRLINTRVSEYFEQNPGCRECRYAMECLGGCRASGLTTEPENLMAPDAAICAMFREGWTEKIDQVAAECIRSRKDGRRFL